VSAPRAKVLTTLVSTEKRRTATVATVSADDPVFATSRELPGAVRSLLVGARRADPTGGRIVVFFPGFMLSPWSYRSLFASIVSERTAIVSPQVYRRGPGPLAGRPSASEEAERGAELVRHVAATRRPEELWLAGHSRGGQIAWRIADGVEPDGMVVIDPVDGGGRHPTAPAAAAAPATFTSRTLVIGAGLGGRCAPAAVNHDHFAAAAPPGSTHVVIDSMGHGDVLDDRPARAARGLCGGSPDPRHERRAVAQLIERFLDPDTCAAAPC
jgi:pimeloyl-ACP methyl ester carboxylesterase